jgi:hypothetical protein
MKFLRAGTAKSDKVCALKFKLNEQFASLAVFLMAIIFSAEFSSSEAQVQERVIRLATDITIEQSGEMEIVETWELYATGIAGKDFVRHLPLVAAKTNAQNTKVDYKIISITRNNQIAPYTTAASGNFLQIRTQDPDHNPGSRLYKLHYRVVGHVGQKGGNEELIWVVRPKGALPAEKIHLRAKFQNHVQFQEAEAYSTPTDPKRMLVVANTATSITMENTRPIAVGEQIYVVLEWHRFVTRHDPQPECTSVLEALKIPRSISRFSFHLNRRPESFAAFICDAQKRGLEVRYAAPGWFSDLHELAIGDVRFWFAPTVSLPTGSARRVQAEDPEALLSIFSYRFRGKSEDATENWLRLGTFTEAVLTLVLFQAAMPR